MVIQLQRRIAALALCMPSMAACAGELGDSSDEPGLSEDVGVQRSELHKGTPGAVIGESNYCDDPNHLCSVGEGDCDSSASCEPGLLCGRGKAAQFGFRAGDGCVPPHCINRVRDQDETQIDCGGSCGTFCAPPVCRPNGAAERCTSDCPCGIGEGDCDSNAQCVSPLVCARTALARFGVADGDACVPAHCVNNRKDADETGIDCGGDCGSVACPSKGCVEQNATYVLAIHGSFRELDPVSPTKWGVCSAYSGTYQRTLVATIVDGSLVVDGWGFAGTYPIIDETSAGFIAQAGDLFGYNFYCGGADPYVEAAGLVTFQAKCLTRTMTFNAQCMSNFTADGCYPNYSETAKGAGARSP